MSDKPTLPPEIEALRQAYLSALRGWTGEIERLRAALQVCDRVLHFDLRNMITWGNNYNQAVKDAADAARAALAGSLPAEQPAPPSPWRPMDEEPPHTMRVLLFKPEAYHPEWDGADYGISVGYFSNGEWRDQGTNHDAFEMFPPTHWMPIPPPPEAGE